MASYSSSDLRAMSAAFMHLYGVPKEVAESQGVLEWMQNAPVGIVEYDGTLSGERSKQKDRRMELYDVYDGQISELVSYLKSVFRDKKQLSKWEIIFHVYSEIMDVQEVIKQAESQVIFGTNERNDDVPQASEELQTSQGASVEEEPNHDAVADIGVNKETTPEPVEATEQESVIPPMEHANDSQGGAEPSGVDVASDQDVQTTDTNTSGKGIETEVTGAEGRTDAVASPTVGNSAVGDSGDNNRVAGHAEQMSSSTEQNNQPVSRSEEESVESHRTNVEESVVGTSVKEESRQSAGSTSESLGSSGSEASVQQTTAKVENTVHTGSVKETTPTPIKEESPVAGEKEQSTYHDEVLNGPAAVESGSSRSGNVYDPKENPLFKENKENMEDTTMAENSAVEQLLKAAEGGTGANPAAVQQVPSSNVESAKADVKEAQQKVTTLLGGEKTARQQWTRNNIVSAIISTMPPAALRKLADEGTVGTQTDANKKAEAIANKLTGFVQLVSGKKGCNVDTFEAMTDTEKWANVVPGETKINDIVVTNVDKAKAMYELLKQVKQNPDMKVPAFIPANPSYPTKGYKIGSMSCSVDEFMLELMDNSNGAIYGEGSITADGVEKENAVSFALAVANKREKAQADTITTQKTIKKVPVVRAKNKKLFVQDAGHVVYLFTQEDTEKVGKATFRAAINVNGALVAAGVAVYSLDDNGNKIVLSHDNKNNKDRYKTRQASVSVSVPCKSILKQFAPEFKGEDEDVIAAQRWNVNMGSGRAQGNFGQIAEFSQTPVFDVFTQVYAGQMPVTGALKNSKALSALKSAADQQAAADAAASASELS